MQLTAFHKSSTTLIATLKTAAGVLTSGATVTVTINDASGTALVTGATMLDQSDGTYEYDISNTLLPTENEIYRAEITAVNSGLTRYSEVSLKNILDAD